jgi:hypothetical protein
MVDNLTTVWVAIISASSAITGVIATQIITAINNRKSDKRKYDFELIKTSLARKIEVGEQFYVVSGENLTVKHAFIHYLKNTDLKSSKSYEFIDERYKQLYADFEKVSEKNSLANLVNIYFDVQINFESALEAEKKLKTLFISIHELKAQISNNSDPEIKDTLIRKRADEVNTYCAFAETEMQLSKIDMEAVRRELNRVSHLS